MDMTTENLLMLAGILWFGVWIHQYFSSKKVQEKKNYQLDKLRAYGFKENERRRLRPMLNEYVEKRDRKRRRKVYKMDPFAKDRSYHQDSSVKLDDGDSITAEITDFFDA